MFVIVSLFIVTIDSSIGSHENQKDFFPFDERIIPVRNGGDPHTAKTQYLSIL